MYECHVTTEFLSDTEKLAKDCLECGFKPAKLYMDRGRPSEIDSFFTMHDPEYESCLVKMMDFVNRLDAAKIQVTRYKIEKIILDSKYKIGEFK